MIKVETEEKERNHYEEWCENWRLKFLEMDQETLKKLLPELKDEGEWMTLFHYSRKFGINKGTGRIEPLEDKERVSCNERLNIYTLFGYVSPLAHFRDQWVTFDELKDASPFAKAFLAGVTRPFARTFTGHQEELEAVFQRLGGRKLPWGDVGYEWNAFSCIPVRFLFWEGDEEFPAQGNILFDKSAIEYIHVESIVTIATVGLARLAKEAGLSLDAGAFSNM